MASKARGGAFSAPEISCEDQISYVKMEKLRGSTSDEIRLALRMVCGNDTLDVNRISSVEASVDSITTNDQISYVKVETLRNMHEIMDIHRAVHSACGSKALSSSTFSRWAKNFRQGKPVRLGYDKPVVDLETTQCIKEYFHRTVLSPQKKGESSRIARKSGDEEEST